MIEFKELLLLLLGLCFITAGVIGIIFLFNKFNKGSQEDKNEQL